jgi:hypothetical protein
MKTLDEIEWGEFELSALFNIKATRSGIDKNKLINKSGDYPYITRTDRNNGWEMFIIEQNTNYSLNNSNVISIGLDTQTVFYQPISFYTGQNIQILSSEELNKYVAMFLIPLLKRQIKKFSWGSNGATLSRLKRQKILLPIISENRPDYAYMEVYMREKEKQQIEQQKKYILQMLKGQNRLYKNIKGFDEIKWKEFKIGDLFSVFEQGKSKGLNHLKEANKGINYLGATNLNNAVLCQVEEKKEYMQHGNGIAFIRNGEGSMGFSVYKAEDFIATSDISVGYNDNLNRYVGTFITTVADRVRGKYNFGYKRNTTRLAKESLMLPIDALGNPDYVFMEQYMRIKEQHFLRRYLGYLEKQENSEDIYV